MRLCLCLSSNTMPISFDHLHQLTGTIHKWLGPNAEHDGTSLYSFGWLTGGKREDDHLDFPKGAAWRVSFHDDLVARRLLAGLVRDSYVFGGMRVIEAKEQAVPEFPGRNRFLVDGPVVVRSRGGKGPPDYLLYSDPAADDALTRVLRWKADRAGLGDEHRSVSVRFDRTYDKARTKLAGIGGILHKGSECPVIVEGTPEAVRFAWHVGVGELTGSGFGALR